MSFYNSNSFTLPSLSILFCRLWLLALTTTTLNMLESGLASTSSLKQNNKYSFHIPKKQNTFWNPQILCEIIWIFLPYLSWFSTALTKTPCQLHYIHIWEPITLTTDFLRQEEYLDLTNSHWTGHTSQIPQPSLLVWEPCTMYVYCTYMLYMLYMLLSSLVEICQ